MSETMISRGPDEQGTCFHGATAPAHNRLAIIDVENGRQPMTWTHADRSYTIIYRELRNTPKLTAMLRQCDVEPTTYRVTEVVLYMQHRG